MPKILLVEDNETIREMLTRRLTRRHYEVVTAGDGETACALARSERPDIVLMDMHLPALDGWEASRRLKTDPDTRAIPIIALTADAMAGERERLIALGFDDYVSKPINPAALMAALARIGEPQAPMALSA